MDLKKTLYDEIKKIRNIDKYEVEFRIRQNDRGIERGISMETFQMVNNKLKNDPRFNGEYVYSKNESTDYVKNSEKINYIRSISGGIEKLSSKNRISGFLYNEYNCVLSVSEESSNYKEIDSVIFIRNKVRHSYTYKDLYRIDLTIVNNNIYELEIELLSKNNTNSKLEMYAKACVDILRMSQESDILYDLEEKNKIFNRINEIFNFKKHSNIELNANPYIRPINLKFRNLRYGKYDSIVGRKKNYQVSNESINNLVLYQISEKTDGVHRLLYINKSGMYFIWHSYVMNKIADKPPDEFSNGEYLFEGELIDKYKNGVESIGSKYDFMIFDCLFYIDEVLLNRMYQDRINKVRDFYDIMNKKYNRLFLIRVKEFKTIVNVDSFYTESRNILDKETEYYTDGLIIMPAGEYNKNPTYKWKPVNKLTIDFAVYKNKDSNRIELYTNEGKFTGSDKHKFDESLVSPKNLENILDGQIVEFRWENKFVFEKVRSDKLYPNDIRVAMDVWDDINEPITENTIRGENSIQLYRKYHNNVKNMLFENVRTKRFLLDIGSGFGGDLSKWKEYDKILAVEPNPTHIAEMKERLKKSGMQNRVKLIKAYGQDSEIIIKAANEFFESKQVDCISMMLSLTFFFGPDENLKRLTDVISGCLKPGGEFIFMTMNGNEVIKRYNGKKDISEKFADTVDIRFFYNNENNVEVPKININFEGKSTVKNQDEYLVDFSRLEEILDSEEIKLRYLKQANDEKFLTEDERTLTDMYSYGVFNKSYYSGKNTYPEEILNAEGMVENEEMMENEGNVEEEVIEPTEPEPEVEEVIETSEPEPEVEEQEIAEPVVEEVIETSEPEPVVEEVNETSAPESVVEEVIETSETELEPINEVSDEMYKNFKILNRDFYIIPSIGDGNCFFHSVLNGCCALYQESDNRNKIKLVKVFRNGLSKDAEKYTENAYKNFINGYKTFTYKNAEIENNLENIRKILDSTEYVGGEVYDITSDIIGVNIIMVSVIDGENGEVYALYHKTKKDTDKYILILGNYNLKHYELMATLDTERKLLKTIFTKSEIEFLMNDEYQTGY